MSELFRTENYQTLLANVRRACDQSRIRLIGIEGRMNEGKSCLAEQLAFDLGNVTLGALPLIHLDQFRPRPIPDLSYLQTLDLIELVRQLDDDIPTMPIIIEGICLREVLDKIDRKPDLAIYVKKLSHAGLWHTEFDLERYESDPRRPPLPKSLYHDEVRYHRVYRPHEIADLYFEWTEPKAG